MSDCYLLTLGVWKGAFCVPNAVADKLRLARGDTLKPLLYLLRYNDRPVDPAEIADHTGMTVAAVRDALLFWEQEGVLATVGDAAVTGTVTAVSRTASRAGSDATSLAVPGVSDETVPRETVSPSETALPAFAPVHTAASEVDPPVAAASAPSTTRPPVVPPSARQLEGAANATVVSSRPGKLTAGEITRRCERDPAVQFLVGESERVLGRPLSSSDLSSIVSLVDWAGLAPDIVLMLLEFCRERGKTNLRYIERVGADWADNGIDTHEKAAAFISARNVSDARENEITQAFRLDRALTSKEKTLIAQWYGEYGYDIRMIRLAYERTVDRTGKLSFPYCGSILRAWYEKGYRDPKDTGAEQSPAKPKPGSPANSSLDLDYAAQQLFGE